MAVLREESHAVHVGEYFNLDELEYAFEFDENEGILLWANLEVKDQQLSVKDQQTRRTDLEVLFDQFVSKVWER